MIRCVLPLCILLLATSLFSGESLDAQYPRSAGELKSKLQSLAPQGTGVKDLYLSRVQQYRLICNVPYEKLTWSDEQEKLAIAASAVCEKLGKLTHTPEHPPGMSDADYELGKAGAAQSNLYAGVNQPVQCVDGWMDDSDDDNIERVGHRRWVLNQRMGQSAFGVAGKYAAMFVFDRSRKDVPDWNFVAYPAVGFMPVEYFGANHAWHVAINPQKYIFPTKEGVTITVQPVDAAQAPQGAPLKVEKYFVDNSGIGSGPAIIFKPEGFKLSHEQLYKVTVKGVKEKSGKSDSISYVVHFIDLKKIPDGADVKAANTAYFGDRIKAARALPDEFERLTQFVAISDSKFIANAEPAVATEAKAAAQELMKKSELKKEFDASQKLRIVAEMEQKAGKDKTQIFAAAGAYRTISIQFKGTRAGTKAGEEFERLKAQNQ